MILNEKLVPSSLLPFLTSFGYYLGREFGYIISVLKAPENAEVLSLLSNIGNNLEKHNEKRARYKLHKLVKNNNFIEAKTTWSPVLSGEAIMFTLNFHHSLANKEHIQEADAEILDKIKAYIESKGNGLYFDLLDNGGWTIFYLGSKPEKFKKPEITENEPA